ncbi:MAG: ATP-binding cassette domain-containing protein [Saprospiraceae bacterium]|nr:ATP-binding cassette domain-containing protein [Saprospiraceae bacterium]
MISAKHLTKKYGDHIALDNLTIDIQPGEIFCLLGQNGAGKTTTINCFLGFTQPTSGQIFIQDEDVAQNPVSTKKHLAYLPEVVMLYPNLSGLENLEYFSRLAGFRYERGELLAFLEAAGLDEQSGQRRLSTYSKGMRQKTGIAIAMAKRAKALFLDEPTSGLDPKASNDFSLLLKELAQEGVAVLMATHDIFRAREVATRIGIMREGKLVSVHQGDALTANELEKIYLETV